MPAGIEEYEEQHVRFVGVPAKIQTGHHLNTSLKHYHLTMKYKAVTGSKNPGKYEEYIVDLISTPAFGRKLFHLSYATFLSVSSTGHHCNTVQQKLEEMVEEVQIHNVI